MIFVSKKFLAVPRQHCLNRRTAIDENQKNTVTKIISAGWGLTDIAPEIHHLAIKERLNGNWWAKSFWLAWAEKPTVMNLLAPISSIMTTKIIAVSPDDTLAHVRDIFNQHNIHHIPVVRFKTIVGMVSKTDFLHFLHSFRGNEMDKFIDETRLMSWKAEEVMTKGLAKVDSTEPIRNVLEVFLVNRFHAVPIVDADELVGIVTTFDLIKLLASQPVRLEDYQKAAKP